MEKKRTKKYRPKPVKLAIPIDRKTFDELMLQLHAAIGAIIMCGTSDKASEAVQRVLHAANVLYGLSDGQSLIARSVKLWCEDKLKFSARPVPNELLKSLAQELERILPRITYQRFMDARGYEFKIEEAA